ncbi:hypothetical protein D0869_01822 [Hortaea werneckii]|uniref:Uncharacterized protein n=1 Tax=Hortaea werneckii TaxID=91943 RepID=A0A3M6ZFJ7_HORWE|nr:hypothetical protein KC316_g532 [Hortaea werneckii]RMX88169.1 hypothetical protein D0869_01822 [Hortaea werneckii]RMY13902.1 hypothetical protein D0868_01755 [Hortaea werneckii]
MSVDPETEAKCKEISTNYSACDVSDALLKLKVPQAGFLPDILPINHNNPNPKTIVAPLSTVLFVAKSPFPTGETTPTPTPIPQESNIPQTKHWTDLPTPGTIVLLQQPQGQICAVCGDILATRLKVRGVKGIVADGRVRDLVSLSELCQPSSSPTVPTGSSEGRRGEGFTVWSRGTSTVGTGLAAQAWCVDVPLSVPDNPATLTTTTPSETPSPPLQVHPGDIIVCDEGERGSVVIPLSKLDEVLNLLPGLKEADEKCIKDVESGVEVREAFRRHR